jgi:anti-anti-sigma factor
VGDIDSAAADELSAALGAAIEDPDRPALVIVDLTEANLLDSRSMGVLADSQARLRATQGRLAIVGARPEVHRLFVMIGLEQTFEFFATADAAAQAS